MKFYKVIPNNLRGKIVGNSTVPPRGAAPILHNKFIKVDPLTRVATTVYDRTIWRNRFAGEPKLPLVLNDSDLELFEEVEDPGLKKVFNIQYVVGQLDYEEFYEKKRFDNAQEAAEYADFYQNQDEDYHYEVRLEYESEWPQK
jgi:hypothetical protein